MNEQMKSLLLAARKRLKRMDQIDGGEMPSQSVLTCMTAMQAGLSRTGVEDECLYDALAMIERLVPLRFRLDAPQR